MLVDKTSGCQDSSPILEVCRLGEIPYSIAWQWQRQRVQIQQQAENPDGLLLLSHPPVYTLGQGGDLRHLRFDPEQQLYEVHRVDRGGEVTYHGPGQWVGYPILNLRRHQQDLHWYLRQLEQVLIAVLADLGLEGERISGLTGVWVQGAKVAAMGIKVSRWISFHGFALNVCPDLQAFQRIVPCGIANRPVGSLQQFLPEITLAQVEPLLIRHFCHQFHLQPRFMSLQDWLRAGIPKTEADRAPFQSRRNQTQAPPDSPPA
jgi:lipoyl(octanoyl) transferase